jgi:hypothetical protein
MQRNSTLTNLNLEGNNLGPEGGKAIAKSLEVIINFTIIKNSHDKSNCFLPIGE